MDKAEEIAKAIGRLEELKSDRVEQITSFIIMGIMWIITVVATVIGTLNRDMVACGFGVVFTSIIGGLLVVSICNIVDYTKAIKQLREWLLIHNDIER